MTALAAHAVSLWLARIDATPAATLARAERWLDDAEQARARRFRVEGARAQFVAARVLLRAALIRHAGVAAAAWPLRVDARGKPSIDQSPPPFTFSLSHTQGLVACALARQGEIGVDVERVACADDLAALSRQSFSAAEADHVAALTGEARVEAFFAYWTLKEAYAKARGLGLSLDTTAFSFEMGPPTRVAFHAGVQDDPERWRFLRAAPTPEVRLALAAAAPLDLSGVAARWVGLDECIRAVETGS